MAKSKTKTLPQFTQKDIADIKEWVEKSELDIELNFYSGNHAQMTINGAYSFSIRREGAKDKDGIELYTLYKSRGFEIGRSVTNFYTPFGALRSIVFKRMGNGYLLPTQPKAGVSDYDIHLHKASNGETFQVYEFYDSDKRKMRFGIRNKDTGEYVPKVVDKQEDAHSEIEKWIASSPQAKSASRLKHEQWQKDRKTRQLTYDRRKKAAQSTDPKHVRNRAIKAYFLARPDWALQDTKDTYSWNGGNVRSIWQKNKLEIGQSFIDLGYAKVDYIFAAKSDDWSPVMAIFTVKQPNRRDFEYLALVFNKTGNIIADNTYASVDKAAEEGLKLAERKWNTASTKPTGKTAAPSAAKQGSAFSAPKKAAATPAKPTSSSKREKYQAKRAAAPKRERKASSTTKPAEPPMAKKKTAPKKPKPAQAKKGSFKYSLKLINQMIDTREKRINVAKSEKEALVEKRKNFTN